MPSLLAVTGLSWAPNSESKPLLKDVDFDVSRGELVFVTGPSGAGKSSLLRCLVGLESFDGELLWEGDPIDSMRRHRQRVAYLLQRPVEIAETIGENLDFPRQIAPDAWSLDEQRRVLEQLGVRDWEPDERFGRLSGGEQQRIALVRSLSMRPTVLLLDEPTASLDDASVDSVEALLLDWLEDDAGRAIVWVSHDEGRLERLLQRDDARRYVVGEPPTTTGERREEEVDDG